MFSSNTTQESGGYEIQRSLRFNSADTAYLNRTPASATNRKTWTWSGWVKRSALGERNGIFVCVSGNGTIYTGLEFNASNELTSFDSNASGGTNVITTQVFRDVSAWYHIVWAYDTTQATASDRVKLYVNGVQITAFSNANYPPQNSDSRINSTDPHAIGSWQPVANLPFSGYMTEVNFIDGQALTPSSFGAFDAQTGVWGPTRYAGSYGTNGFYLNFSDNSNTTAATLGADYSGNGNNWTPNNFSVSAGSGNDSLVDSPTSYGTDTGVGGSVRGNYCTLNPLFTGGIIIGTRTQTIADGNLYAAATSNSEIAGTLGVSSGKWYFETNVTYSPSDDGFGIGFYNATTNQEAIYRNNATAVFRFAGTQTNYGVTFVTGDVVGVALDLDNTSITFYVNGVSQGVAKSNLPAGTYIPYLYTRASSSDTRCFVNFGQRAFVYTAPSGFKALNTQNLPTPTVGATATTQAVKYFNPVLYTGAASNASQSISTLGFQPDLVWVKGRSAAYSHSLYDSVRGSTKELSSNLTDAESTQSGGVTAFNSNGFSVGNYARVNQEYETYVAWNWKANGAGVTNTAGSITSTVSANTTSGFSVVTYTGSGVAGTIGHGLGAAPAMVIVKSRSATGDWPVYHASIGNGSNLLLNSSAASASSSTIWNSTSPTSSVFSVGINTTSNTVTVTYVAYAFAEVPGYSKFGSYTGNGSADGPFCFTGMRPAYVMYKKAGGPDGDWVVLDVKRDPTNVTARYLAPNGSQAESNDPPFIDILSNGFKMQRASGGSNENGVLYIFAAFAEFPFKYSLAR
jgi:hypothetical protein